jgi:hypothetical protein
VPGTEATPIGESQVIRYNSSMSAQATQGPLPNLSLNRSANGMPPWPRGSRGSSSA